MILGTNHAPSSLAQKKTGNATLGMYKKTTGFKLILLNWLVHIGLVSMVIRVDLAYEG